MHTHLGHQLDQAPQILNLSIPLFVSFQRCHDRIDTVEKWSDIAAVCPELELIQFD
jgi:hypothetical protein